MAFAYLINPTLKGTRADAEAETTHDQVVYAREGIHRYVTTFYTDASLQTPYTGYIQQTSGNIWLSYTAATSDGDDGGPFTTPYNAGTSTASNKKLALAAEGASRDNATQSTLQNKRVWTCEYDTSNNKKYIGSAKPRT